MSIEISPPTFYLRPVAEDLMETTPQKTHTQNKQQQQKQKQTKKQKNSSQWQGEHSIIIA